MDTENGFREMLENQPLFLEVVHYAPDIAPISALNRWYAGLN